MLQPSNNQAEWFQEVCAKYGIIAGRRQVDILKQYVELLLAWNSKINLISRRDEENIWRKHVFGSIAFLSCARLKPDSHILDLGTGGGLPGIPLAILLDSTRVTMIDSTQKKIKAVSDMIHELRLTNARAVAGRAEELGKQASHRSRYEYVVSRAVAPVHDLIRWSKPFLLSSGQGETLQPPAMESDKVQRGSIVMIKGGDLDTEISSARKKHPQARISVFSIPSPDESVDDEKKIVIVQP